ncbi:hypothetical protein ACFOGI_12420 [Virgibacillus xinjiangensis]|uniref:Uncharacterized protein n=1 Tax=Virgibacillus xinjiangensis TaxID=393090 RepID=A0ABV7CY66_9BACI
MNRFNGAVFRGELDIAEETFYLTQVKSLSTQSTLSEKQLVQLSRYLEKQSDTCTITVNDQLPILLKEDEIEMLQQEISRILSSFQ